MSTLNKKLAVDVLESLFPDSVIESHEDICVGENALLWKVLRGGDECFVALSFDSNIETFKLLREKLKLKHVMVLSQNRTHVLGFGESLGLFFLWLRLSILGFTRRDKFCKYDVCIGGVEFHNSKFINWMRRAKYGLNCILGRRGSDVSLMVYSRIDACNIGSIRSFFIRDRGSMVTIKHHSKIGTNQVYRSSREGARGRIKRNYDAIRYIKKSVPGNIGNMVPGIAERNVSLEKKIYVEDYFPGVIGWKSRSDPRVYSCAIKEAVNVIIGLQKNLPIRCVNVAKYFLDYVSKDINKLPKDSFYAVKIGEKIDEIISKYRDVEVLLTLNHGDFGLGNVIINPRVGKVQGIIDWDTYVENDLLGLDIANLSLQEAIYFKLEGQRLRYDNLMASLEWHLELISSQDVKSYLYSIRDILLQASIIRFVIRDVSFKSADHRSLSICRDLIDVS